MNFGKKLLTSLGIILLLAYATGVGIFSFYSYPNTSIGDLERGLMPKDRVFDVSNERYNLTVKGRDDKTLIVNKADIDLTKSFPEEAKLDQHAYLWPFEILKDNNYDYTANVNYDEGKLLTLIEKSDLNKKVVEPEDAELVVNDTLEIKPEVMGNKLDQDKLLASIKEAIASSQEDLVLEDQYINPTVVQDDPVFKDQYEKMAGIYNKNLVLDFEDKKYELGGQDLFDMYDDKDGVYTLNEEKLWQYVVNVAYATDTYAKPHEFEATGIGKITVPGGIYGWQMDMTTTYNNLKTALETDGDGPVEVAYLREARERGQNDIGNTYVEVDLSRQHLWLYVDGKLVVETDIVSGDLRGENSSTPVGVNMVWSKEVDRYLVGNNAITGAPYNYHVDYWMPIGWTGSGLHDTKHRTEYGGEIYKNGGGSGACINIPLDKMKVIFENTPNGTAVVTYESSTNYSVPEFERQAALRELGAI